MARRVELQIEKAQLQLLRHLAGVEAGAGGEVGVLEVQMVCSHVRTPQRLASLQKRVRRMVLRTSQQQHRQLQILLLIQGVLRLHPHRMQIPSKQQQILLKVALKTIRTNRRKEGWEHRTRQQRSSSTGRREQMQQLKHRAWGHPRTPLPSSLRSRGPRCRAVKDTSPKVQPRRQPLQVPRMQMRSKLQ
jgi:hypothetical protein